MVAKNKNRGNTAPSKLNSGPGSVFAGIAAAGIASFFVFQFLINPALAYDAQQPVFFTTAGFLARHLAYPGGPAEYLGLLLSQSWYYGLPGSLVSSIVLCLVLLASAVQYKTLSGRFRPLLSLLLFLPLISMHCSYYHPMKLDILVLFSLIGAVGYSSLHFSSLVRKLSVWLVSLLAVSYLAGCAGAALFVIFSAALELCRPGKNRVIAAVLAPAAGTALLWLFYTLLIVPDPVSELLSFFDMGSVYQIPPLLLVAFAGLSPIVAGVPVPAFFRTRRAFSHAAAYLLLVSAAWAGIRSSSDESVKKHFLYDTLSQNDQWQEIYRDASEHTSARNPLVNFNAFYGIRAMFHTNQLFDFIVYSHAEYALMDLAFCANENGETDIANSDLYFEMGAVNHAIWCATEAMALYGYSPRILKRLALCYAAQEKIEIARSMTNLLKETIIGKAWARSFLPLLDDTSALAEHRDIRRLRLHQSRSNFILQLKSLSYEFRHIWLTGSTFNKMAAEYFLASAPRLLKEYLDFMVLAGNCRSGETRSCDTLRSALGQTFWYQHMLSSPQLFDFHGPQEAGTRGAP